MPTNALPTALSCVDWRMDVTLALCSLPLQLSWVSHQLKSFFLQFFLQRVRYWEAISLPGTRMRSVREGFPAGLFLIRAGVLLRAPRLFSKGRSQAGIPRDRGEDYAAQERGLAYLEGQRQIKSDLEVHALCLGERLRSQAQATHQTSSSHYLCPAAPRMAGPIYGPLLICPW